MERTEESSQLVSCTSVLCVTRSPGDGKQNYLTYRNVLLDFNTLNEKFKQAGSTSLFGKPTERNSAARKREGRSIYRRDRGAVRRFGNDGAPRSAQVGRRRPGDSNTRRRDGRASRLDGADLRRAVGEDGECERCARSCRGGAGTRRRNGVAGFRHDDPLHSATPARATQLGSRNGVVGCPRRIGWQPWDSGAIDRRSLPARKSRLVRKRRGSVDGKQIRGPR